MTDNTLLAAVLEWSPPLRKLRLWVFAPESPNVKREIELENFPSPHLPPSIPPATRGTLNNYVTLRVHRLDILCS